MNYLSIYLFIDMKQLFAAGLDRRTLLLWKFTFVMEAHFCYQSIGSTLLLWKLNSDMKEHFCYGSSLLLRKHTFVKEAHFCYGSSLLLWKHTFVMEAHFCYGSSLLCQIMNDDPLLIQSSFKHLLLCFTLLK